MTCRRRGSCMKKNGMKDKNFIETPLLTERFEQAFVYALQLHAHPLCKADGQR